MKLSEIKGERTFDVIADLIDPIANIAGDEEAAAFFKDRKVPEGMEPREFVVSKLRRTVPKLLKGHKRDLCTIIATLKDVPVDEYVESLTLASLMGDLAELFDDEEFTGFLS